jgi:hypothetical protein
MSPSKTDRHAANRGLPLGVVPVLALALVGVATTEPVKAEEPSAERER